MKIVKNSNFSSTSNRRAVRTELTWTKMLDVASFLVTSKDKNSIQVLRIVGLSVVLFVDYDESMYSFLKFPSHNHHSVFSFPVLLQRNQDVDSLILEHLFHSTWVSKLSRYEFFPFLLRLRIEKLAVIVILVSSFQDCFGIIILGMTILLQDLLYFSLHSLPFGSFMLVSRKIFFFDDVEKNW